jgi:hypothetical protein
MLRALRLLHGDWFQIYLATHDSSSVPINLHILNIVRLKLNVLLQRKLFNDAQDLYQLGHLLIMELRHLYKKMQ